MLVQSIRQMVVIIVSAVLVVVFIALAFGARGREEAKTLDLLRRATQAEICVLALPVRDDGRNHEAVRSCLERYELAETKG